MVHIVFSLHIERLPSASKLELNSKTFAWCQEIASYSFPTETQRQK